jgi:hypothetical protein
MSLTELIRKRLADDPSLGELAQPPTAPAELLESVLKGREVELWSDSAGRLFLVADPAEAQVAIQRFGTRQGEIYTAGEIRLIVAVKDPEVVAEIHEWKRQFDGVIRELRTGDPQ